jgi:hypothetical protein
MLNLLRYTAVFMLVGRAYEHLRWIGPYRDFFFNPIGFGKWYAQFIGRDLADIYKDPFYEQLVSSISSGIGIVFLLAAVVLLFYERLSQWKWIVYLAIFFLLTTFLGYFMAKHFKMWGMLLEHASQLMMPLLFVYYARNCQRNFMYVAVWSVALTFYCHGLFAIGYYPQPGKFVDMFIASTGWTEDFIRVLLKVLGWLDILMAAIIVLPFLPRTFFLFEVNSFRLVFQGFVMYGVIWGGLTTLARLYATYTSGMFWHWADQYWFEFLVRWPHFVVPLVIFLQIRNWPQFKMAIQPK